jgi:uncharacterized protein YdeI (YjbR/CyaY-like superfamily)
VRPHERSGHLTCRTVADPKPEAQLLALADLDEWERWLEAHHDKTDEGVWLRIPNKAHADTGPPYVGAVEAALCFGWIDGQTRKLDETARQVRFTPRRKRSVWGKINVERAERLIAEGRMRPAGIAEVERAKADGRWDKAYEPPSKATIPDDFLAALEQRPKAKAFFATLNKTNTFAISFRLSTAVKPETRARRLEKILDQLDREERFFS